MPHITCGCHLIHLVRPGTTAHCDNVTTNNLSDKNQQMAPTKQIVLMMLFVLYINYASGGKHLYYEEIVFFLTILLNHTFQGKENIT